MTRTTKETPVSALVFTLVLAAAVFHASWNAAVKSTGDRLVSMALVLGTGGLISIPFLFLLPLPEGESWPYIAASAVIHLIYGLALARMFDAGDLSQTYPIARGSAPIMIFLLAAVFADEWPTTAGFAAIALISAGIISLSVFSRPNPSGGWSATAQALFVGLIISLYTYADGQGVRLSGHALSYITWMFFLTAVLIVPVTMAMRRHTYLANLGTLWKTGLAGGVIAILAYGIVIWAMSVAPMAYVAALRETSVVFAAFIGVRLLGEDGGRWRIASAAVVVAGAVALQQSGGSAG
jgi:drug/metabolite transporter (DMT)-like permease